MAGEGKLTRADLDEIKEIATELERLEPLVAEGDADARVRMRELMARNRVLVNKIMMWTAGKDGKVH